MSGIIVAKDHKCGHVGMMLSSEEIVLTVTGRQTTPFPKFKPNAGPRSTAATFKKIDRWLMENALLEAESRGDEFNALQFRANLDRPQKADKDSAEYYLFNKDFIYG